MKKTGKRSSDILLEMANHEELKGELTYQCILLMLGDRAFGIGLLFFALPSALLFLQFLAFQLFLVCQYCYLLV